MGSTTGISGPNVPNVQASETSAVQMKIESQIGTIRDLTLNIKALFAEIEAGRPVGKDADDPAKMQAYQQKVNQLNVQIENAYKQIGQATTLLNHIQQSEMPAAERKDAENLKKQLDAQKNTLDNTAKTVGSQGAQESSGAEPSKARQDEKISLKVIDRKIDYKVQINDQLTLKDAIKAFAVLVQLVGDGTEIAKKNNPAVRMPHTPGSGIPPIHLP